MVRCDCEEVRESLLDAFTHTHNTLHTLHTSCAVRCVHSFPKKAQEVHCAKLPW